MTQKDISIKELRVHLLSSLEAFTRVFFEAKTGREFIMPQPEGRQSHVKVIFEALEAVFRGDINRLIINVPPRYGKTNAVIHFVAWCLAHYPDSNFIYVSYAKSLAKLQTQTMKEIVEMPLYQRLFDITVDDKTSAKDDWRTTAGGSVYAAGSEGAITGRGGGISGEKRFGGALLLDDLHKPIEVTSDVMRLSVIDWYYNTLSSRTNDPSTPIIFIGQRLHEDDLPANLIKEGGWEVVSIKALDEAGNALDPQKHTKEALLEMQEKNSYVFSSQYQQDPLPAGGGIFKKEWFTTLDYEPDILHTIITIDTAETSKTYNDSTVFTFGGVYEMKNRDVPTGEYAVHVIDCVELHIEPKDLESYFYDFYYSCMRHKVKPSAVYIEKKSTGVTLFSVLNSIQGLRIVGIERTAASGNKASRYLEIQQYAAEKRITFPTYSRHTAKCIEHMSKITANDSHAHDDICDTITDLVKVTLIDRAMLPSKARENSDKAIKTIGEALSQKLQAKSRRYTGWM